MSTSGYEGGVATTDMKFGFVLRMHERRKGAEDCDDEGDDIHKDTCIGNAVLVGPRLAITAVHCLADPISNLWVRSALGGSYVRVVSLRWPNPQWQFVFGSATSGYPPVRRDNWAEDIVELILEKQPVIDAGAGNYSYIRPADPQAFGASKFPQLVGIASPDGSAKAVRYSTFSTGSEFNRIVRAEVSEPVRGYPLESGSAVLAWEAGALTTRLLGLQASAPDPIPLRLPILEPKPVIGFRPLAPHVIEGWQTETHDDTSAERSTFMRRETQFYLREPASQRVVSGERSLVTVNDLRFFDGGKWRLHAARSRSGILTSGGWLHTSLLPHNEIALKIVIAPTNEELIFRLYPSSALGIGGFYWLQGSGEFKGRRHYLYLFRAVDDAGNSPVPLRRRVRVAIFDVEGPHLADRPEYCQIVEGAPVVADDDRVQDDIGNGHEGQDPP